MKSFLFILSFCAVSVLHAQYYKGYNMVQMSRWDQPGLPSLGTQKYSNCWGWADSATGREYAIVGSIDSTYFIEVTNPASPIVRDVRAGASAKSVWREYKTYKNYCYAVADAGPATLQIFDMSYLPDSVHLVYDSDELLMRSHTIWVDKDRLYCNSVTTKTFEVKPVEVLSLADPANPVHLSTLVAPVFEGNPAFYRCHDAYVRNDTLYCSGENSGMFIYDYSNPLSPQLLATINDYPEKGYNHSSYVSDDGQLLVFTDENSGLGIKAFDISDLGNIELESVFRSHAGAIAHNPYFIGRRLYVSYYHDGVYVYDMNNPKDPQVIAWYDTYPQNGTEYQNFEGCWGIYPYLPSRNILAIDMTNGLFVLHMDAAAGVAQQEGVRDFLMYPNPAGKELKIEFDADGEEPLVLEVYSPDGRKIMSQEIRTEEGRNRPAFLLPENMSEGMYIVYLKGERTHLCKKLIKR
jgi:choice-of-anchor B domain-containing protein